MYVKLFKKKLHSVCETAYGFTWFFVKLEEVALWITNPPHGLEVVVVTPPSWKIYQGKQKMPCNAVQFSLVQYISEQFSATQCCVI